MITFKKHKRFEKSFRKLSPKLQSKTSEVLKIFVADKYDISLNNHALKGEFIGLRSINLTGDHRIIFSRNERLSYGNQGIDGRKHSFGALKNIYALYRISRVVLIWFFYYLISFLCSHSGYKKIIQELGGGDVFDIEQFSLDGDILATYFGNSRNRYLGKLVGEEMSVEEELNVLKSENKHAEGDDSLKGIKNFIAGREFDYKEILKIIDIFL